MPKRGTATDIEGAIRWVGQEPGKSSHALFSLGLYCRPGPEDANSRCHKNHIFVTQQSQAHSTIQSRIAFTTMNLSHESNSSHHFAVKKRGRESDTNPDWPASNKKIKQSLMSKYEGEAFSDPPNHFVLCGRGERTNRHPGNKSFRRLVDINKSLYHSSDRRKKGLIATSIVQAIFCQDPPGSFIREDKKSGLWVDVGIKQAIKKTSQALRENAPERKEDKNDKPDHEGDQTETETDDSEYEHEDSNQDRDASQNLSRRDFSWAHVVTYEEGDNSSEEDEDNDDKFSSQGRYDHEGFNHVVVPNLLFLPKDDLSDECPLAHNITGVPHPPAFTHGASDWTLKSLGSVFEDMVAGVPSPSTLTFGTSNWTSKNVSSVQEVPGELVLPTLASHTSDWTLKSICSVFSDDAHSLTNDAGKTVDPA